MAELLRTKRRESRFGGPSRVSHGHASAHALRGHGELIPTSAAAVSGGSQQSTGVSEHDEREAPLVGELTRRSLKAPGDLVQTGQGGMRRPSGPWPHDEFCTRPELAQADDDEAAAANAHPSSAGADVVSDSSSQPNHGGGGMKADAAAGLTYLRQVRRTEHGTLTPPDAPATTAHLTSRGCSTCTCSALAPRAQHSPCTMLVLRASLSTLLARRSTNVRVCVGRAKIDVPWRADTVHVDAQRDDGETMGHLTPTAASKARRSGLRRPPPGYADMADATLEPIERAPPATASSLGTAARHLVTAWPFAHAHTRTCAHAHLCSCAHAHVLAECMYRLIASSLRVWAECCACTGLIRELSQCGQAALPSQRYRGTACQSGGEHGE
jgi:hypothetical protein